MVDRFAQHIVSAGRGLVVVMLVLAAAGAGIVRAGQVCEAACPMHQPEEARMACCSGAGQEPSAMGSGGVAEDQRASSPCCDRGSCLEAVLEAGERATFLSLSMEVSAAVPPRLSLSQPHPYSRPGIPAITPIRAEKSRPLYKITCTYLI